MCGTVMYVSFIWHLACRVIGGVLRTPLRQLVARLAVCESTKALAARIRRPCVLLRVVDRPRFVKAPLRPQFSSLPLFVLLPFSWSHQVRCFGVFDCSGIDCPFPHLIILLTDKLLHVHLLFLEEIRVL